MSERIAFYNIVLMTVSILILVIGNYQIINASAITSNTHDCRKNNDNSNFNTHNCRKHKDNSNFNTHDSRKHKDNIFDNSNFNTHDSRDSKDSKDSTFFLPFNSNFADRSMKTNNEKNDIIPFP